MHGRKDQTMQLAHRRHRAPRSGPRRGPLRGQTRDRSAGVALIEAAFVTPVFMMLVLGMMELGLAMNDNLALAHTVRSGTRVASASGNDIYADYGIVRAVARESSALQQGQIKMIVVYRADRFGDPPSPSCQLGFASATLAGPKPCNVYFPSDFTVPKSQWGCQLLTLDKNWCPRDRKVSLSGTGTEYVGVWIKIEHPWITRMFGTTLTLTDQSVIRLEPRVKT